MAETGAACLSGAYIDLNEGTSQGTTTSQVLEMLEKDLPFTLTSQFYHVLWLTVVDCHTDSPGRLLIAFTARSICLICTMYIV